MLSFMPLVLSLAALALSIFSLAYTRRARVIIAEGFATADAVHAATGLPVAVAMAAPDPWIEPIREWLASNPAATLTPDTILAGALPDTPSTRPASTRITAAMKALGYRATRVRLPGSKTLARVFQPHATGGAA